MQSISRGKHPTAWRKAGSTTRRTSDHGGESKIPGLLVRSLSGPAEKLVSLEIDKDLSKSSEKEIGEHLPVHIWRQQY